MSRLDAQFKLRLPAALRDRLEQAAKAARRSLNAELLFRLEASFEQYGTSLNPRSGQHE